jgi:hypothetical protein
MVSGISKCDSVTAGSPLNLFRQSHPVRQTINLILYDMPMTLPQLIIPILMVVATPTADTPPTKLEFPLAGFRINAIEPAKESSGSFSIYFPVPGDGPADASVGVDRQPTMKTRPSLQNFQDAKTIRAHNGDTILMEHAPSSGEWRMEYTSTMPVMGNQPVPKQHIYQRVCSANGTTYVVSAEALDTEWAVLGPQLKAGVDSFELSTAPAPDKVSFPGEGFRINKSDRAVPKDKKQTLLEMHYVSVHVEPYAKTLKDYQGEHEAILMKDSKNKILAENTPTENTLVMEYIEEFPTSESSPSALPTRGSPPNVVHQLMVCEKMVLAHGQLYMAAGLHFDWDKATSYAQMKACVESLEAMPIPTPIESLTQGVAAKPKATSP